jgi:hypothetical protein
MRKTGPLVAIVTVTVVALGGVSFASDDFSDVPDTHPFHDDISWMADTGITEGFDNGTFQPSQPVTRQAMAAFMRRLAGADPAVDPVVDAALLDGRTPGDFDNAATLMGNTPEDLLPDYDFGINNGNVTITGGTSGTANPVASVTVPPGAGSTAFFFSAMVDTSHDSATFTCESTLVPMPTLSQLNIGDAELGYTDRLPISALLMTSGDGGATMTITCYANNRAGTGDVIVVSPRLLAMRLGD